MDIRLNADRIYRDIFNEYSSLGDSNRNLQPAWITEAREAARSQQNMVIQDLEEKLEQAPPVASDEFMYQDKEEAVRELEVAKKILEDIPLPVQAKGLEYRTWNPIPYKRFRGSDEPSKKDESDF
ncbi:hypothetical protein [Arenibacter lacus]|uniref:hypothetical protein n=1 Tax=Arenibacter lacus TaxID=2608629 RepID=UPI001CC35F31|nr:hypothetical protein [Arenibacter lacus]